MPKHCEEELKAVREVNEALAKAHDGDPTELNRLYDKAPKLAQVIADWTLRAEQGILEWWGGLGKGPKLYLEELRESLGHDVSGGLERLVIDRIAVCWLRVQQAEHIVTDNDKKRLTDRERQPLLHRLEVANRTFLRACKTLAQIRRLMKRDIGQINIAQQQVNIAQAEDGKG